MHMFYENAAQLLLMMTTRVGLGIKAGSDCHTILMRLAQHHMQALTGELRDLSHAGAASWIHDDLEKGGFVTCSAKARRKVQAALGTMLVNFLALTVRSQC